MQVNEKKIQLQRLVIDAINKGRSQNALGRSMDVSAATLVSIKNGQWDNISDKMINKCLSYFKLDTWQLMNTWNMQVIAKLCNTAKHDRRFMAIAGYTGAGKTTALREYAKQDPETFLVHATSVTNRKMFLSSIQNAMGIRDGISVHMMVDGIIRYMNTCTAPLLIIDDAGKLSHNVLLLIQIIYDATENRAGIILAGTEYLDEMIRKGVQSNRLGFRELERRISYWQSLRHPSLKAVEEICSNYGIKEQPCIKYIHEAGRNYGDIRNIITNAIKIREESGKEIDRAMLESLMVGKHNYNLTKAR